ncbi:MAG: hypothetical protein ACOX52_23630 [Verrucomicrobiota bacterium]|jgi:hypothetical protein
MNEAETRAEHIDPAAQAKNFAGKLAIRFAYATNGQAFMKSICPPVHRVNRVNPVPPNAKCRVIRRRTNSGR